MEIYGNIVISAINLVILIINTYYSRKADNSKYIDVHLEDAVKRIQTYSNLSSDNHSDHSKEV